MKHKAFLRVRGIQNETPKRVQGDCITGRAHSSSSAKHTPGPEFTPHLGTGDRGVLDTPFPSFPTLFHTLRNSVVPGHMCKEPFKRGYPEGL